MGDHSIICPWGGDRVKRHNRLRSLLPKLLLSIQKLRSPGFCRPGPRMLGPRMMGCTLPALGGQLMCGSTIGALGPAALDLAVTSGHRQGASTATVGDGGKAAEDYEARKRSYQDTQNLCAAAGFQFLPWLWRHVEADGPQRLSKVGGQEMPGLCFGEPRRQRRVEVPGSVAAPPRSCTFPDAASLPTFFSLALRSSNRLCICISVHSGAVSLPHRQALPRPGVRLQAVHM